MMRYDLKFEDGGATVCLVATLPLPEEPLAVPEALADMPQLPALAQIERLPPAVLSEIVFGRSAVQGELDHRHPLAGGQS